MLWFDIGQLSLYAPATNQLMPVKGKRAVLGQKKIDAQTRRRVDKRKDIAHGEEKEIRRHAEKAWKSQKAVLGSCGAMREDSARRRQCHIFSAALRHLQSIGRDPNHSPGSSNDKYVPAVQVWRGDRNQASQCRRAVSFRGKRRLCLKTESTSMEARGGLLPQLI